MKKIKFSILIPVYNVEKYIERCIDSIKSQSYDNYEVIMVDDGTKDQSGVICDIYAKGDSRVKVIHQDNGGLMYARRIALKYVKGDYVIFLDSDDYLKPDALATIYKAINKYNCDCVIYGMERVFEGKVVAPFRPEFDNTVVFKDKRNLYLTFFTKSNLNAMWRKAVKSSVFKDWDYSKYYRISCGEDLLQSIEIYKNSYSIVYLPICLYNYTFNPNSITQSISQSNYNVDFTVRETVLNFIKSENVFSEKDYINYRTFCVKLLCEEIERIIILSDTYETFLELLRNIKNTEYYKYFLKGCIKKNVLSFKHLIVLILFEKNMYTILYFFKKVRMLFKK